MKASTPTRRCTSGTTPGRCWQIRALSEHQIAEDGAVDQLFGPKFLLERPLLEAVRAGDQAVLLIDEVDRADDEFEAFLLEVLSDFQVSIPEIGTINAPAPPLVVLTSNRTRELHDALKRRCLYHWIGYPPAEREVEIVLIKEPGVSRELARKVVAAVHRLRELDLAKPPGVAETIDWARTLDLLGGTDLDPQLAAGHPRRRGEGTRRPRPGTGKPGRDHVRCLTSLPSSACWSTSPTSCAAPGSPSDPVTSSPTARPWPRWIRPTCSTCTGPGAPRWSPGATASAVYDEVFRRFFLDAGDPVRELVTLKAQASAESDAPAGAARPRPRRGGRRAVEAVLGWMASDVESLKHKAFAACTAEELAAVRRIMARIKLTPPRRRSRRTVPGRSGHAPDLRRTVRESLRLHGEPAELFWRQRRVRLRPLILILDISGSMADYSRNLLQFAYSAKRASAKVEVFCFGTRLTRITRELDSRRPDEALGRAARAVFDWEGGTRIGACLDAFVRGYGRRGLARGGVVVVCSDGLDRGDPGGARHRGGAAVPAVSPAGVDEPAQGRRRRISGQARSG